MSIGKNADLTHVRGWLEDLYGEAVDDHDINSSHDGDYRATTYLLSLLDAVENGDLVSMEDVVDFASSTFPLHSPRELIETVCTRIDRQLVLAVRERDDAEEEIRMLETLLPRYQLATEAMAEKFPEEK